MMGVKGLKVCYC